MISIQNVSKAYQQQKEVLKNVSLDIKDNEMLILLGESGSGKTTLLKMINKLVDITSGKICIDNMDIKDIDSCELRRNIGYVVQETGLFPHMTVKDNIEIINKIRTDKKSDFEKKTEEVLKMVGLDPNEFMYRFPRELSGGQAQRVGVARAYAIDPQIILMDEPFSALDPITRNELQNELLRLQKEYPKTIVFVTHDVSEAIKLADRIVLLHQGVIEQVGTPRELLTHPNTDYISKFFGENRIWKSPWLLKCCDIMSENITTIHEGEELTKALEIIKQDAVQAIMVVDKEEHAVGKLTEKILMRNIAAKTVREAMKRKFDFAYEDTPLHNAVAVMNEKDVLYLPVVDAEMHLRGMLSMTDLLIIFDQNILSETAVAK